MLLPATAAAAKNWKGEEGNKGEIEVTDSVSKTAIIINFKLKMCFKCLPPTNLRIAQ